MATLIVRNAVQQALFQNELLGQMTDGMWENTTPQEDVRTLGQVTVAVTTDGRVGRDFYMRKQSGYSFNSSFLFDCVGDRMVEIARKVEPTITEKQVRAELRDLSKIWKERA